MANKTLSKLSNNFTWGFEFEIAYIGDLNENNYDFETYEEARNYWDAKIRPKQIKDIVGSYFPYINGDRKRLHKILKNFDLKDYWEYDKRTYSEIIELEYDEKNEIIETARFDLYNCNTLDELFKYVDCDVNDIAELFENDEYYRDTEDEYYQDWESYQTIRENMEDSDYDDSVEIIKELFRDDLPVYKNWAVVSDSSIEPSGAEIVSPILSYNNAIAALENVFEFIDNNTYLETNSSTGLHINVGTFSREDIEKIDLLKFLLFFNDVYVAKIFNRLTFKNKNYAKTLTSKLRQFLKDNNTTLFNANLNQTLINSMNDKYQTVNFNKFNQYGYLEIRAPGNSNYHYEIDKVKSVMGRIAQALTIASDPNAYVNEYGKKLSLLLNDSNIDLFTFNDLVSYTTPIETLQRFINYYNDNIKADELKNIAKEFKNKFSNISKNDLDYINNEILTLPKVENNLKLKKYIELLIKIISK